MEKRGKIDWEDFFASVFAIFFGLVGVAGLIYILTKGIETAIDFIFFGVFAFLVGVAFFLIKHLSE